MGERPRFVFASSIAAFGGGSEVTDETKLVPDVRLYTLTIYLDAKVPRRATTPN